MMSLNKMDLSAAVKKQLNYKMKVYVGMFSSLVFVQVIGIFFSVVSPLQGYSTMDYVEIEYMNYNTLNIITLTSLWALIHAIIMTTKNEWENAFPFVGNTLSNHLANMIFLVGASIVAGIVTILASFTVRVYLYYFTDERFVMSPGFVLNGGELFAGTVTVILHFLLLCAVGYLLGTVTRLHRLLPVLLPIVVIGLLITINYINHEWMMNTIDFYYGETSMAVFLMKIVVTAGILFACSIAISSRTEVRK